MRRVLLVWVLSFAALEGCGESGSQSCDEDTDCPLGEHCAAGFCDLECRADIDCIDLAGAVCDDRGRCGGCLTDADCDDGIYCNGAERCVANSCSPGDAPCEVDCNEVSRMCDGESCPDFDGDGFTDFLCGGDDCDDEDADAYPGNTEVCDAEGHDEDCDPDTFGADEDGDGYESDECCNGDRCGTDCDDDVAGRNPGAVDACGGGDEDCDGDIDEEPDSIFYRDQDSDNYGVTGDTLAACSLPSGYAATPGDCADDPFALINANEINPGATEICDTIDNNCNGVVDTDVAGGECVCTNPGAEQECGLADLTRDGVGTCRAGVQTCTDGAWTTCVGFVAPVAEVCDAADLDEDCDGSSDESGALGETAWYGDADGDGFGDDATSIDACERPSTGAAYVDVGGDCDDTEPSVYPNAAEICDHGSQDCDGRIDEGVDFECLETFSRGSSFGSYGDANWSGGSYDAGRGERTLSSASGGPGRTARLITELDASTVFEFRFNIDIRETVSGSGYAGTLDVGLSGYMGVSVDMDRWVLEIHGRNFSTSQPPVVVASVSIPPECRPVSTSGGDYSISLLFNGSTGQVRSRFREGSCPLVEVMGVVDPDDWLREWYEPNRWYSFTVRLESSGADTTATLGDTSYLFRAGVDGHRGSCVACIPGAT